MGQKIIDDATIILLLPPVQDKNGVVGQLLPHRGRIFQCPSPTGLGGTMKTGSQSNIFDYDTGNWNHQDGDQKQTTNMTKPPFAAVTTSLLGETFEEQLIRLGKIRNPDGATTTDEAGQAEGAKEEYRREEGFSLRYRKTPRKTRIFTFDTEVH